MAPDTIPEHIRSTYDLVRCVFPEGIPEAEYFVLLHILQRNMSQRVLAETLTFFTSKNQFELLHDVLSASVEALPVDRVDALMQRLLKCGYDDWLREDT
jgi:hypothetical protein